MKTMKKVLVSLMMLLFTATLSISPLQTKAQGWVSVQYFYDHLSPHGNWVYYPDYGNVWVPHVHSGFRPYYTNGRWVYTNYGWMWVSSYRWGWATFHYGSWNYDPWYGWMWIPGYRWAPAWVTWGYYGGYYGWAPVGPGFVYGNPYYPPMNYWTFVHPNHMASQDWQNNHYVPSDNQIVINNVPVNQVENITLINNSGSYSGQNYHAGPTKESFEKVTKQPLQVVSVKENAAPGKDGISGNEIARVPPQS
jgi:hypothetical protein